MQNVKYNWIKKIIRSDKLKKGPKWTSSLTCPKKVGLNFAFKIVNDWISRNSAGKLFHKLGAAAYAAAAGGFICVAGDFVGKRWKIKAHFN